MHSSPGLQVTGEGGGRVPGCRFLGGGLGGWFQVWRGIWLQWFYKVLTENIYYYKYNQGLTR